MSKDYTTTTSNGEQVLVEVRDRNFTRFLERIRMLVYANKMNYNQLAKALNTPLNLFYRYENGTRTPDLKILIAVANYFHVSVDWLLGIEQYDEKAQKIVNGYEQATDEDKHLIDTILQKYGEL